MKTSVCLGKFDTFPLLSSHLTTNHLKCSTAFLLTAHGQAADSGDSYSCLAHLNKWHMCLQ